MMKHIRIAAGIIRNAAGEIFITQRAADAHMAGKSEFPGGKIEAHETPEQALVRELHEEIGISATDFTLFQTLEHTFDDRHIAFWFFMVDAWEGEPWGKEGQAGSWVAQTALDSSAFPPANAPVIARLRDADGQ